MNGIPLKDRTRDGLLGKGTATSQYNSTNCSTTPLSVELLRRDPCGACHPYRCPKIHVAPATLTDAQKSMWRLPPLKMCRDPCGGCHPYRCAKIHVAPATLTDAQRSMWRLPLLQMCTDPCGGCHPYRCAQIHVAPDTLTAAHILITNRTITDLLVSFLIVASAYQHCEIPCV